jgi:hypothetical protein
VAQLMLDHRLGKLHGASADLERSRKQLLAINQVSEASDLELITAGRVVLAYDRWADHRRSELNLVIARQTVTWMDARDQAQTAFGRVQALQGLATRLNERR